VTKVSLYIDVDGVLCPFGATGRTDWGTAWSIAGAGLLEVSYAVELVKALNDLAGRPDLRFVWLTSWESLAPEFLCPAIGLAGQEWPVLAGEGLGSGDGWWKLQAIQQDLETSTSDRAVWIDDQLDFERAAQGWAAFLGARLLLISPDPRRGLSRADLASVQAFL
jgi:HAD domain in Swiss Army Knife RNA repair proteins